MGRLLDLYPLFGVVALLWVGAGLIFEVRGLVWFGLSLFALFVVLVVKEVMEGC